MYDKEPEALTKLKHLTLYCQERSSGKIDLTSPNKYILPAITRQLSLSPFNC